MARSKMAADGFAVLVQQWATAAGTAAERRNEYRVRWSQAYMTSDAKTDTARKAEADVKTGDARLARDMAQIEADACFHTMIHEHGQAASAQLGRHEED